MRRSATHNRLWLSVLGAVALAGLGLGAPTAAQITITKLQPDKIRYVAGEEATFAVTVKNAGAQAWSGKLVGTVESGVAQVTPLATHDLQLAAGAELSFTDKLRVALPEFGSAVHVVAQAADGTVAAEGREVFCVGPWYYNMGRYLTFFETGRFKTPEDVLATTEAKWRSWYVTCHELFSTAPGLWGGMVPTTEQWFAGQNGYYETLTGEKAFIEAAHRLGQAVMVYDIVLASGALGEEYSRAHPDYLQYNDRGRPNGAFNMADADFYRHETVENHRNNTPVSLSVEVSNPQVQDAAIAELVQTIKLEGYDGIRWDGHNASAGYTVFGGKIDAADLDRINTDWTRKMKAGILEGVPYATINYNWGPQSIEEGVHWPETYKALGPNAYVLWESINGRWKDPNDPLNVWEGFVQGVRNEINDFARPNGNFQHFGWYGFTDLIQQNHTQAVYYAAGGHWDTWNPLRYDAFSMRYGAYFWDTKLKNLTDPTGLVQVADPANRLWWKQFVHVLDRGNGKRMVVTHVLNKPMHERQDEFEKDAPPIQKDVAVTLTPEAGEKVERAFVLTADADRAGWCREVKPVLEGNRATVVVPSVEYWSFVVWELAK
ncbi:MAG TPA: hypothetical protein VGM19_03165 [Armatimonadota bacterium]|jgi:hypothetical protein